MITKDEIQTGNILTDEFYPSFNTLIVVNSINDKGINLEIQDDGNIVELAQHTIEPEYTFDKLRGIPITPERLTEWCGFKLCKPYVNFPAGFNMMPYYAKNGILLFFNEGDVSKFLFAKADQRFGYYIVVDSGWHDKLHELQNFYFWNSGKQQLTISAHRINKASKD